MEKTHYILSRYFCIRIVTVTKLKEREREEETVYF